MEKGERKVTTKKIVAPKLFFFFRRRQQTERTNSKHFKIRKKKKFRKNIKKRTSADVDERVRRVRLFSTLFLIGVISR